jgi:hypothetical protein
VKGVDGPAYRLPRQRIDRSLAVATLGPILNGRARAGVITPRHPSRPLKTAQPLMKAEMVGQPRRPVGRRRPRDSR